ncbi:MAG TPA: pseudouridine synthase, partial [Polyangiaceae bacterium]|nr:pseudouridine synthase [Polyangiaceae bacterium]
MASERLQKILARGGVASRRATEDMIRAGRVRVNGRVVTELGTKADPRADKVELDGKRVVAEDAVYVLCHKPRGVVSTLSDPEGRATMATMLSSFDVRLFPVGRLDFATSGALLATNDGEFSDGLLHPKRAVPKTYVVKVNGIMEKEHLDRWRRGLELDDGPTQPAEVNFLRHEGDKTWFELTIKEGRNQQIRRMGEASGFLVMRLSRVAFAGITTEGLPPGGVRPLTRDELGALKKGYGVPKKLPTTLDLARAREEAAAPRRVVRSRPSPRPDAGVEPGARRPQRLADDARGGFREDAPRRREGAPVGPRREAREPSGGGERFGARSTGSSGPSRAPRGEGAPRGEREPGPAHARVERGAPGRRGERSAGAPERERGPAPRGRGPAPERGRGPAPERGGERGAPRG